MRHSNQSFKFLQGTGDLCKSFVNFVQSYDLFHPKDRLLLAVSGGLDSTVLCELCNQAGYPFAIAHCNFQLRGEESDGDENFVRGLAAGYGVEIFIKSFDTTKHAAENGLSVQVAARELRYNWFQSLIALPEHQFAYLLTAHHADDNVETILMNFFKGTGINGLKGILPKQEKIIRPLLFAKRRELEHFALENNLKWREDSSNESDKYSRNYFRHQVIPNIIKIFPESEQNLLDNAERFRGINIIYNDALEQIKHKLIVDRGNQKEIAVLKLLKTPALATVVYEIIKDYNFTAQQVPEVLKLLNSESGKYIQSHTHQVLRNRAWLIISPIDADDAVPLLIGEKDKLVNFPGGRLLLTAGDMVQKITTDTNTAQVDARNIQYPLLLRKWKTGDYFYPLGMPKKKKLSRFLIDQKMSRLEKQNTWVLESDKKIIWIMGRRIDDRFKITTSTTNILLLELRPAE